MADLITMLSACGATEGEATDADFQNTVLLLHGDGTNGAQNNTFLDSSTNNFTITRNGNTTQGTFTPFSKVDGRWGTYYDGTDDYLSVADNAVLRPGAGAFTLEAWIYRNASGAAHTIYAKGGASTGISFLVTSGNVLRFTHTTTNIDSTGTVAANVWVHVAVVREGTGTNQTKLYINGTQDGQGTVSTDFTQTEEVRIGTNRGATDDFAGYISNVRFVKGSALYTGNFTPSTSPFTTTSQGASSSEVELLTCQSNRFKDNSTNNFTITRNGDVKVTPFSPFPITTAYDPAVNGGSAYFDGSGDYLSMTGSAANRIGTSDYTVEFFVYPLTVSTLQAFLSYGSSGATFRLFQNSANLWFLIGSSSIYQSSGGFTVGQWFHVALVRSGSGTNNCAFFLNGTRIATFTNTSDFNAGDPVVGAEGAGSYNGYLANFRVVKSAIYSPSSTTITVPTAPYSVAANTAYQLNFTNAGIYDNTGFNNLETVADAQIDTTVKKYGTGSMEFDGSGDYLFMPSTADNRFGSGNWTIEFWFRTGAASTRQIMVGWNSIASGYGACNVNFLANGKIGLQISETGSSWKFDDTTTGLGSALSANTWYFLAVTRSGQTVTVYIDGSSIGTYSLTSSTVSLMTNDTRNVIGISPDLTNQPFNGYIDDLRITKGIARYTTTFTPPTAAFPNIGE